MKPVKPFQQELLTEGRLPCSYKFMNMPVGKFNALPDDKHNLHI